MMALKRILLIVLFMLLVACQSQVPSPVPSEVPVAQSVVAMDTVTPTPLPVIEPTATEELDSSFILETIKMFASENVDETSGWAVGLLSDGNEYILRTQDGGQSWKRSAPTAGIVYVQTPPVFLSSQIAWNMNLDDVLERTTDGGLTWTPLLDFQNAPLYFEPLDIEFWDQDNGMAISGMAAAGTAFLRLWETRDGGATWKFLDLNPPWDNSLTELGELQLCNLCGDWIYFDGSRIAIVFGLSPNQTLQPEIDFEISLDNGHTWTLSHANIPDGLIDHQIRNSRLTFFDDEHGVFSFWATDLETFDYYNEYSVLFSFYTSDGGQTWKMKRQTPTANVIDQYVGFERYFSPTDAIARCGSEICVTNNGATTWSLVNPDADFFGFADAPEWFEKIDFATPVMGFAISADGSQLYRTVDGGMHWDAVDYRLDE